MPPARGMVKTNKTSQKEHIPTKTSKNSTDNSFKEHEQSEREKKKKSNDHKINIGTKYHEWEPAETMNSRLRPRYCNYKKEYKIKHVL